MDNEQIEALCKDTYIKDDVFMSQIEKFEYEENSTEQIFIYGMKDKKATRAVIPYGVTCIERHAFEDMESLGSVDIPETMEEIYDDAFAGCKSLVSIRIPKSVTFIAPGAFRGCDNLFEIEVDEENEFYTSVDGVLFSKDMDEIVQFPPGYDEAYEYIIPGTVTTVLPEAFAEVSRIDRIVLTDSIKKIEERAFWHCTSLRGEQSPGGVTELGAGAFTGCEKLVAIRLGQGLARIPENAFSSCSCLKEITLHDSVREIGKCAFAYCEELRQVNIVGNKKTYKAPKVGDSNLYFEDASIKFLKK